MADTIDPLVQECGACGALIDVTEEEPFSLMHCPTCGVAMRVRREFGKFELQEVLGAGGMGAVYRATDTTLNRPVALKLLRRELTADPEFVKQFEHEAAITAYINHPNVVKVYSTGESHGIFYIAMELVDKGSLDDLMTLQGRVGEAQVLEVGIQIAHGLNAAYKSGLIHRDVKPGNILFADAQHAKIVDFGLARPMDQSSEHDNEIWGTPYYVAPEKLDTPPKEDLRSDIYSLGATLFHAIAGRPPYEAEDASMVALKHLKSQPVSLQAFAPDVHTATSYVINKSLNKDPEERYATYEELIEHLEYARDEVLSSVSQPKNRNRVVLEDERSQQMMMWVTLGILGALVLGGIGIFVFRDKIFGSTKSQAEIAAEHSRTQAAQLEPQVQAARTLLANGKSAEAAAAFEALDSAQPEAPQPERNWITLQAALSRYLEEKPEAARALLTSLVKRGPFSFDPSDEKLANFFLNVGNHALDSKPAPASLARDYSKTSYEAIALLLFAAKDWAEGDFDDAGPLFRQFHSATPEAPYNWMDVYRSIAERHIEAYAIHKEVTEYIHGAASLDQKTSILPKLDSALEQLTMQGVIAEKTRALVTKFKASVAELEAEMSKKQEESKGEDTRTLAETKTKMDALCAQYRYAEARDLLQSMTVLTPEASAQKTMLAQRMGWLAEFKAMLVKDLAANGYPGPLTTKAGAQVVGAVSGASDAQLQVKTQFGAFPVKWSDLSTDCVYLLGRMALARPGLAPEALGDREWGLGIFAILNNKLKDGRILLTEAAKNKPEYRPDLESIPEAADSGATPQ